MEGNFKMMAKTFYGFEEILAKELRNLGAMNVKAGVRGVTFEGDTGFMYKANLSLRTALKVLKQLKSFPVNDVNDLYRKIYQIDWSRHFSVDHTFAISFTGRSQGIDNTVFAAQKIKDGIVDRFRDDHGKRPSVNTREPDFHFVVHVQKGRCFVSLDSSGSSLHHRGYRTATNIAPINEVLAAGILLLSGWDGQSDFLDPMCGSGTFLVEAAMIACNIPVNINRKGFAFEKWPDFDADLYEKILDSCWKKTREFHHKIIGYDKAPSAVEKSIDNVVNANLDDYIAVRRQDFFQSEKPVDGPLHMVFNPPYGERLNIQMEKFYARLGETLKHGYPGSKVWFITSNLPAIKHVGLRPSRKIKLFNGKLESRLLHFEMYAGSKKAKKQSHGTQD
ncbi:THUMP domain-containing class I SAM-dependent RNA methyltransferase [Sediminicola luteus]|uniref:RNA methyltransferase n=1 Tax=Sediminicola luteus TaxID=319238 RepID=A0A2A4G231_9FLAO|nr:THUMP domain-containing protein [Sediminicola luteus]PCE62493.1 RNA methyltransferase [Sediminicola luteus]